MLFFTKTYSKNQKFAKANTFSLKLAAYFILLAGGAMGDI